MGKPNKRHHELCLKYKQSGQREVNKAIKAERNKRRVERFARKRAEKQEVNWEPKDPETRGSNREEGLGDFAWRPKQEHMVPYAKERSFGRRIQNQLNKEIMEAKHEEMKKNGKGKKKSDK